MTYPLTQTAPSPACRGGLGRGKTLARNSHEGSRQCTTPSQPPPASKGRSQASQDKLRRELYAFVFALSGLILGTSTAQAQSSDNALYTRASIESANGEQIFHSICQGCHMPDAKGATGAGTYPALAGNTKLASPQYMAAVVLFGRHDMPSFATKPETRHGFFEDTKLSDEQIAEVINYVRTHFGNNYPNSISAADVAAMHPQDQPVTSKP